MGLGYLTGRTALVKFEADWCMPCKACAPAVKAAAAKTEVELIVINVDDEATMAETLGIRAIPTVIGLKNGELIGTLTGVLTEEKYMELAVKLK